MHFFARAELINKMKEIALLEGQFTLRSGKTSTWYFDKYRFEGIPGIMRSVAHHMARLVPDGTDRLAGIELGGVPMVTALSLETELPSMFIRKTKKDYGTAAQIEGVYNKSDRIVLVEDVVTTGGQAIEMINSLRAQELNITGVIAVLNRNEGADAAFDEIGVPFWALFSRDDFGF